MAPDALEFAKDKLTAGAQPTIVRKLLQDKFGTKMISKDLINIKQTLTGKSQDEWVDTVEFLQELQENPNNIVKVFQSSEKEIATIFVQVELQRKLYLKYGTVIQLDGTYNTTKAGFGLYHLLIHDNNRDGQPVAFFFIKEETTEAISECLQIFTEKNDISLTEVTITDEDCAEISALSKFFPKASGILCQFHVLKVVDTHLQNKFKISLEKKNEIRKWFRSAVYAASEAEFFEAKSQLKTQGQEVAVYFDGNWFNIPDKWTYLGRRQLSTFGNNTTNRPERYHHTLKEVLQKNRRLPEVIRRLINLVRLRLSDMQLKQSIREMRFNTKGTHPVLKTFSDTFSPYACKLLDGEMKILNWKAYDFVLNEELDTYSIPLRHTTYSLKRDLTSCTCKFFMDFGLPCRHIISCHIKNNTEIPAGSFLDHWRNECLENDAVVPACVSSATGTHYSKQLTRKPITDKDQFNVATTFFRKVADTLSQLSQSDFEEKMKLFDKKHVLIKEGKPVQLIQPLAPTEIVSPISPVEHFTDMVTDPVSTADEGTLANLQRRTR
ncbi:hypothetical protein GHT06_018542 [Daphnia sinensis]|uniref:SWIM-type domain-containing protein n=1 Tax=Daphnia sinensis TaxID=1820382 RepID=A0AAD5KNB9_9CRUS|nr:hypothetical protein GHT06_018542 [Daphnia sinensis]